MPRKYLEIGGLLAGAVLVVFGIVSIVMSVDARSTVRDSLAQEQIYFGEKGDPAVDEFASQWAGQQVKTGEQARAMAEIMREHTLSSSGNLTYAQLGRYAAKDEKGDDGAGGTNDPTKAQMNADTGQPVANPARELWVTETALSTALNTSYMAENLALFGVVVGVALLLSGIGFIILSVITLGEPKRKEASAPTSAATPVAG